MIRKSNLYTRSITSIKPGDLDLVGRDAIEFANLKSYSDTKTSKGFVISSICFDDFLTSNNIVDEFIEILSEVEPFVAKSSQEAARRIVNLILTAKIPDIVVNRIYEAYDERFDNTDVITEISFSHVIKPQYLHDTYPHLKTILVSSREMLVDKLKYMWIQLFTPEAIEERANKFYKGEISTALLVKEVIKSELSGKILSIPTNGEDGQIEIQACFGVWSEDISDAADIYRVDIHDLTIAERIIVAQNYMRILQGNNKKSDQLFLTVPISNTWVRRQTLNDAQIMRLTKELLTVEKNVEQPVVISWGFSAGDLFILHIDVVSKSRDELNPVMIESETLLQAQIQDLIPKKLLEKNKKSDIDLKKLEKEISTVVNEFEGPIESERMRERKKDLHTALQQRAGQTGGDTIKFANMLDGKELSINHTLDISSLDPRIVDAAKSFSGIYYDGTALLRLHKKLPEALTTDRKELQRLIEGFAIDIGVVSKTHDNKQFMYQFSNITELELKEHNYKDTKKLSYYGDERFIEHPEGLIAEYLAIEKARRTHSISPLNLVLPPLRNISNFNDLKKVLTSQGFKRSASLKLFSEFSVPSILIEFPALDSGLMDGVVIDYEQLLVLYFDRETIRYSDHRILFPHIERMAEHLKHEGVSLVFKITRMPTEIVTDLFKLAPESIVFSQTPPREQLELLIKN